MREHIILAWSGYEHEHIERDQQWYIMLAIIAVSLALSSMILGNILFGIIILMAGGTIALISRHPPQLTHFEISDHGIRIDRTLHRWKEILAFWVDTTEESSTLLIDTTKPRYPNIVISLRDIDPKQVRAVFIEHVQEIPMKEPLAHRILDLFGL